MGLMDFSLRVNTVDPIQLEIELETRNCLRV